MPMVLFPADTHSSSLLLDYFCHLCHTGTRNYTLFETYVWTVSVLLLDSQSADKPIFRYLLLQLCAPKYYLELVPADKSHMLPFLDVTNPFLGNQYLKHPVFATLPSISYLGLAQIVLALLKHFHMSVWIACVLQAADLLHCALYLAY